MLGDFDEDEDAGDDDIYVDGYCSMCGAAADEVCNDDCDCPMCEDEGDDDETEDR